MIEHKAVNPQERQHIRQQLHNELEYVHFQGHEQVIRQTHPVTWRSSLHMIWNYELEWSWKPSGIVTAAIISALAILLTIQQVNPPSRVGMEGNGTYEKRQLIDIGGNIYWQDAYERAVKQYEIQN